MHLDAKTYTLKKQALVLWGLSKKQRAKCWVPTNNDVFFVAGNDWCYAEKYISEFPSCPVINLIQGMRHADPQNQLYQHLKKRAVRICVSEPVAQALQAIREVNGPIYTINNGIALTPADVNQPNNCAKKIGIIGYKMPDFARQLERLLMSKGFDCVLYNELLPKNSYISLLKSHQILVCLPLKEEGFYLTALEAMSQGAITIVPDCKGNRVYIRPDRNCFVPRYDLESTYQATLKAMYLSFDDAAKMRKNAINTTRDFSLEQERFKYLNILEQLNQIW